MRIGAHLPTRGGLLASIAAARERTADAAQLFASNPRAWAPPRIDPGYAEEFRSAWRDAGLGPLFVHAPYLVNIASPNPEFLGKSVDLARATMAAAEALGAAGLVVHAGAGGTGEPDRARERAAASLGAILPESGRAALLVELMAGSSGAVASTFPEAAGLFAEVEGGERLRLCADTCHLFAAGYGLDRPDGVRQCFAELRGTGLVRPLVLVHANDAKFPRGSRRDRHHNVGQGLIGRNGFAAILADPAVRRSAVVCETPGDAAQHRRDVETLRELAGLEPVARARTT
ncbi:MAG: deoxyribonuclease IV [Actinomycetota bacterium]|nr:deoxyribonuclease IV [Actinomycetota bacterium]